MKKLFWITIAYTLILTGCTKSDINNLPEDGGCIERILIPVTKHSINSADIPHQGGNLTNGTSLKIIN